MELAPGLTGQAEKDGPSPLPVCYLSWTRILGQIRPIRESTFFVEKTPLPPELTPGHSLIPPKSLLSWQQLAGPQSSGTKLI